MGEREFSVYAARAYKVKMNRNKFVKFTAIFLAVIMALSTATIIFQVLFG